ncbi:MAG TPA: bacterial transcriptional activator domain-containing protein [Anaerolineae bacterium]|nr:bacterial transcriptional activator domain-containing protein [Anaerolineae bacterium]HMR66050.1 bacterial transcriptional activator domain-containing protein [Anaerolineae bacterium]
MDDRLVLEALPPVMLSLLGVFRLVVGGQLTAINSGSKSEYLLVCLALARRHCLLRADLLERLWPEYDPNLAGQSLNSLTSQINKLTVPLLEGAGLITHVNGYYCLNTDSGVGLDIDYFETWQKQGKQLLNQGHETQGLAFCRQALALYHGDLCGDANLQTVMERERLRVAYLDLLAQLADYHYRHAQADEALTYIHRLLAHDPCREDAHRLAMRCYLLLNQRAQALRQYRLCCQALLREFEAQPEPATVALYEQIRTNKVE